MLVLLSFGEIGQAADPGLKELRAFIIGLNAIPGPGGVNSYLMNKMKALVVDDDSLIRRNVAEVLLNDGLKCPRPTLRSKQWKCCIARSGRWYFATCV